MLDAWTTKFYAVCVISCFIGLQIGRWAEMAFTAINGG